MTTAINIAVIRDAAHLARENVNLRTKQLETKTNFSQAVSARMAANAAVKKIEAAILDLNTAERIIDKLSEGTK
jgi:hypothetical protein